MQKIRASINGDLAQAKLKSDVVPASDAILDLLGSKPDSNGQRHGGWSIADG